MLGSIPKALLPSCSCKGVSCSIHIQILIDLIITVLCILLPCRHCLCQKNPYILVCPSSLDLRAVASVV